VTALWGLVDTQIGPVNFFCTHMQADLPVINLFDLESVNLEQAQQLVRFVQSKMQENNAPAIIMGDFNTGPGVGSLDPLFPRSYQTFINNGMRISNENN
jgi:endonuclease/exonuclease/phosphatase family metal-dependent hydrolase